MLKCGDSMIKPHMLSLIPSSCLYVQLPVLATIPRILMSFCPSHVRIFCFARIRLNPLSGKILYYDSVLVIVSRFTALIEDFVICRYQVTKLFRSRFCFASASSARGFWYFGSPADVAISVFQEVGENTMLPRLRCHFRRMFRI